MKDIMNPIEVAKLYLTEPKIGYFLRKDAEYKDDVRLGLFIYGTAIDLTTGKACGFNELAAVKFGDYWYDFFTEDVMDAMSLALGFPYDWDDEEDEDE